MKVKESENVGLDPKNSSNLNFDLISQAIIAWRKKRSREAIDIAMQHKDTIIFRQEKQNVKIFER